MQRRYFGLGRPASDHSLEKYLRIFSPLDVHAPIFVSKYVKPRFSDYCGNYACELASPMQDKHKKNDRLPVRNSLLLFTARETLEREVSTEND